jgi:hypothetical protein
MLQCSVNFLTAAVTAEFMLVNLIKEVCTEHINYHIV